MYATGNNLDFGSDLGVQSTCDEKTNRYVITGAHDQEKLQSSLDGFIEKFVLCPSCKNPETDLVISKDGSIDRLCKACGAKLPVDMNHKLVQFILKNPGEYGSKKNKKDKKAKKNAEAEANESDGDEHDDELTKRIHEEAAMLKIEVAEQDFQEDVSEAAIAARRDQEISIDSAVAKLVLGGDDDDEAEEDPLEVFAAFVAELQSTELNIDLLVEKAIELEIRDDKACVVLVQILLTEVIFEEKQLEKYASVFLKFLKDEKCEKAMLGGIERLVTELYPQLLPKVALIFKDIYAADMVSEEVFLSWAEKPSKKYVERSKSKMVHEKASPFINWLREADEESEDE